LTRAFDQRQNKTRLSRWFHLHCNNVTGHFGPLLSNCAYICSDFPSKSQKMGKTKTTLIKNAP
jgi:hypothetical protein